ncbi:hypothetical protein B5J94_06590 [Moraxella lacunata]|uniref:HTH lysR-type domain-containing protein n=3 Tax=Moraxella lacunata TaxID=477 RepID=A0A1V4GXB9_MORLA|nr:hypothetical protein B5J94_06590 [Moraxella lacunata]
MIDVSVSQLGAFIHLAKTGGMSQSAHALGISQPTLSRHIASLENILGQVLIDRTHRPMRLTEAGEFFFEHVQKSVGELNELILLTQKFGKTAHSLTIGFVASVLYGRLPEIIGKLKQHLPNLDIRLIEISSNEQMHALKTGQIDVGFGRFLSSDGFICQTFLTDEKLVVALPMTHVLAKQSQISLKTLAQETLITYHRTPLVVGEKTLDPLLNIFYQKNISPKSTKHARDIQIALGLVSAGEGMTFVPESLSTVRSHQIAYLPLADHAVSPIYLNTLATTQHPHISALLNAIHAVYDDNL